MTSSFVAPEKLSSKAEIVDLVEFTSDELAPLWRDERNLWEDVLYWDAAPTIAAMGAALERRSLGGKALRIDGHVVGCGYYLVAGQRAIVGGLMLSLDAKSSALVSLLIGSLISSIKTHRKVSRIESQFIPIGIPYLQDGFRAQGSCEHRRLFLRRDLERGAGTFECGGTFEFEPWNLSHLSQAARLMHQAHEGKVDSEMNELYRTKEGCRTLLENILYQQGCGNPVPLSSYVARKPPARTILGFIVATEISRGHAHLAQIAVGPSDQGLGLGKLLLARSVDALADAGFLTVSLMVSESNQRAVSLYESLGFRTVLSFPVFSWDRRAPKPRSR